LLARRPQSGGRRRQQERTAGLKRWPLKAPPSRQMRSSPIAVHKTDAVSNSLGPRSIEDVEVLVVDYAGRGAHPQLELHLVTAAQRSYSLSLFEGKGWQFASGRLVKCTMRPTYAL